MSTTQYIESNKENEKKLKNMTKLQKDEILEKRLVRKMKRCLKFGAYLKAYKATEMQESIVITPKNYELFNSKYIANDKS